MIFSYAVRSIYIESCSLFVRGGVYRVVKEAMGGFLAKLSVSALMFDYILTGPISGVSAGQYIMGLVIATVRYRFPDFLMSGNSADVFTNWGSVFIAVAITLYFFRQNIIGIHESSGKALKIMIATTVMAVVIFVWCGITLVVRGGPVNRVPAMPDFNKKIAYDTVTKDDPYTGDKDVEMWKLNPKWDPESRVGRQSGDGRVRPSIPSAERRCGQADQGRERQTAAETGRQRQTDSGRSEEQHHRRAARPARRDRPLVPVLLRRAKLRQPGNWMSMIGVIGLLLAFGHSILAMSGEETLAQVYREVESPKMLNFKKAAFVVFVYSVVLTGGISFLAVLLIPDAVRMHTYSGNLIGGLAMYMAGPYIARLLLNGFVVVIGFLILAGAVNTAIIGSNGVLNRVAEDGVMPDWFLKPHRRYGTTSRILYLVVGLQLLTILLSGGNMDMLGEAYAFGVVWSFVFKALAMIVLRFKDRTPREYKVPLNFHLGGVEIPFGLILVFLVLMFTALLNLLTKEVATISGSAFTLAFLVVFMISERIHEKRAGRRAPQARRAFQPDDVRGDQSPRR